MKTFDLTKEQPPEANVFDLTEPDSLLVIDEKLNYIADLLETALRLGYLKCDIM